MSGESRRITAQAGETVSSASSLSGDQVHHSSLEALEGKRRDYKSSDFEDSRRHPHIEEMIRLASPIMMSPSDRTSVLTEALNIIGGDAYKNRFKLLMDQQQMKTAWERPSLQERSASDSPMIKSLPFEKPDLQQREQEGEKVLNIARQYVRDTPENDSNLFANVQDLVRLAEHVPNARENLGEPFAKCVTSKIITWRNQRSGDTSKLQFTDKDAEEYLQASKLLKDFCVNHGLHEYAETLELAGGTVFENRLNQSEAPHLEDMILRGNMAYADQRRKST